MQIFKYLSLFLFVGTSTAQTSDSKAVQYENMIYQAELLIMERDYPEAIKVYNKAYQINNYLFAVDIENALMANIQIKDWKKSVLLVEKLMMKGVEITFFNSHRFKELRKTKEWEKVLKKHKKIRSEFQKGLNQVLVDSLIILKEIDQLQYCEIGVDNKVFNDVITTTIQVDSLFINLLKSQGFPTEEKTGVEVINDTILSYSPKFSVLLRHSYQANSNNLKPVCDEAIKNLSLKRDLYDDLTNDNFSFVLVGDKVYENITLTTYGSKKEKTNYLRKKIIFKNTNNKVGFNFYTPLAAIGDSGFENEEWFKADYTFLVKYKK